MMFVYTLLVLLVTCAIHVVVHRVFLARGVITPKLSIVYGVGFVVVLWIITRESSQSLFWTSLIFYTFSSFILSYWYTGIAQANVKRETPAAMILSVLSKKKLQTADQLTRLFSQRGLFDIRLQDLHWMGLVTVENGRYTITFLGKSIACMGDMYQLILHGSS